MICITCLSRDAIDSLLAGVKALKKKGLAPQPKNLAYANAYGIPPTGFAIAQPLDRPLASLPLAPAMPLRWQAPMTLASQQQSAVQPQPQGLLMQ